MYKYYIHDKMNCYVSDDFRTAYDIVCDIALNYNGVFWLYIREENISFFDIDELTAYWENIQP